MAIHHDVNATPHSLAHRGDACFRGFHRLQAFDGHRARHSHALESGETICDRGSRQIREALRVIHGSFVTVFHPPAPEVAVSADVIAHRPAKNLGERQPGSLAHDVPQGKVDARDGCGAHDAVPVPEMLAIHHLPEMLGPRRVLADEQLRDVLDGANHAARMPFKRGLTPAD